MAIALDTTTQANITSNAVITLSHTCTGSNLLLIVTTSGQGNAQINSVTYNSVALTRAVRTNNNGSTNDSEIWYLANPTTGANNIVATLNSAAAWQIGGISLTGVNQASPLGVTSNTTGSSNAPSLALTTGTDNSWIIDSLWIDSAGSTQTVSTGGSQTKREDTAANTSSQGANSTRVTTTAGSYTNTWSWSNSKDWALCMAEFKPSIAAPAGASFLLKMI